MFKAQCSMSAEHIARAGSRGGDCVIRRKGRRQALLCDFQIIPKHFYPISIPFLSRFYPVSMQLLSRFPLNTCHLPREKHSVAWRLFFSLVSRSPSGACASPMAPRLPSLPHFDAAAIVRNMLSHIILRQHVCQAPSRRKTARRCIGAESTHLKRRIPDLVLSLS